LDIENAFIAYDHLGSLFTLSPFPVAHLFLITNLLLIYSRLVVDK